MAAQLSLPNNKRNFRCRFATSVRDQKMHGHEANTIINNNTAITTAAATTTTTTTAKCLHGRQCFVKFRDAVRTWKRILHTWQSAGSVPAAVSNEEIGFTWYVIFQKKTLWILVNFWVHVKSFNMRDSWMDPNKFSDLREREMIGSLVRDTWSRLLFAR